MGRCSCEGLERSLKKFLTYVFSHVGLCTLVAGYSVAGAFLFRWLEQQHIRQHYDSFTGRQDCVQQLADITAPSPSPILRLVGESNSESVNWTWKAGQIVEEFEIRVVAAVRDGLYDQPPELQRQEWNIIGSLFYCVTVITTIGYGHIAPRTFEGRLSTIFYAVIGIPLFLLTLNNIGNSMASTFRFAYTRLCCCCVKRIEEPQVASTRLQQSGEPPPFIPHQHYSPKRKKMIISPPISATLHRGSDLPNTPKLAVKKTQNINQTKASSSSSPSPIYLRSHPLALAPEALEARKLVAECAAYATSTIPGFTPDPRDLAYDPNHLEQSRRNNSYSAHDYDLLNNTMMLEPATPTPSPSTVSPTQSTPSSPLSRDAPVESWNSGRDTRGLLVAAITPAGVEGGGSSSSHSTRAASPSWISPSCGSFRAESSVTWADEDPKFTIEGLVKKAPPGKTLVVYNTMSGDALQQQSKIARRMAARYRKKHRVGGQDDTTMFMDPNTGRTVDGNMMGIDIRPIPPEAKPKDVRVPLAIVLTFVAGYVMVGALLFQWLEGWSLSNAAYFCFITLSTIGFGDFVPGTTLGQGHSKTAQLKLVASSLYLLFGLAVLAMSFTLVQEDVVLKCKAVAQYIGLMKE